MVTRRVTKTVVHKREVTKRGHCLESDLDETGFEYFDEELFQLRRKRKELRSRQTCPTTSACVSLKIETDRVTVDSYL